MKPRFEKKLSEGEVLYVVNYYGQLTNSELKQLHAQHKRIILDNSQDFFAIPVENIDTLYSCRKFFGVPDGGYLYTTAMLEGEIEQDISYDRMTYLLGRLELDAATFYSSYVEANMRFANENMKTMSKLTKNLLGNIDYKKVKAIRTENFEFLHNELKDINMLNLRVPEGAFMYPLFVDNGSRVKRKLIEKKIYIPTLWPDVFENNDKNSIEWKFAEDIVPLPIDQRYTQEDMEYVLEVLSDVLSERN